MLPYNPLFDRIIEFKFSLYSKAGSVPVKRFKERSRSSSRGRDQMMSGIVELKLLNESFKLDSRVSFPMLEGIIPFSPKVDKSIELTRYRLHSTPGQYMLFIACSQRPSAYHFPSEVLEQDQPVGRRTG
jgi:hypothetical protein